MTKTIRLTVTKGPHKDRRFCFCGPMQCLVGRSNDCFARFSGAPDDLLISRRHCRLDIDPPLVRVHDLGSLNGTYVNGQKLEPSGPAQAIDAMPVGLTLSSGDTLSIDGTTLLMELVDCPYAGNDVGEQSVWETGETARVDCPMPC